VPNYGSKRKPKIATPYLDYKQLKSCKIDLYFSLPKKLKNFKVYYGATLISNSKLKK
jgi:hypothetical protein